MKKIIKILSALLICVVIINSMSLNIFAVEVGEKNDIGSAYSSVSAEGNYTYYQKNIDDETQEAYITDITTGITSVLRVTKDQNGNNFVQGWEEIEEGIDYATKPWDFQIFIGDGGKVIFEDSDGVLKTIGIMVNTSEMFPGASTRVTYPTGWYKSTVNNGHFQVLGSVASIAGQIMTAVGLGIGVALGIAGSLISFVGSVVYYTKDVYTRSLSPCVAEYYTKYSFYEAKDHTKYITGYSTATQTVNLC